MSIAQIAVGVAIHARMAFNRTITAMAKTQSKSKSNSSHQSSHRARPQRQERSKRQDRPRSGNPLEREAAATLKRLQSIDPGLKQLLAEAYGYVVFPKVGKAALVIGGAYGRGAVFERGKLIGFATIGQTTIGVQIGGDTFTELLVFENKEALERFKHGRLTFAASASAVLVKAGAAATADYEKGVSAFAYADGGMLLEAAIGGQKLRFKPVSPDDKQGQQGKASRGSSEEQSRGSEEDSEEGQQDQQGSEGGGAMQMIKRHPWASGLVGIAALAGAAYFAARAIPSDWWKDDDSENDRAEDSGESDEEGSEESEDDDQAEDSYDDEGQEEDDQNEDSGEDEEAGGEYDDEAEGRRQDEDEEDEESDDPDRGKSRRRDKESSRQRHSW